MFGSVRFGSVAVVVVLILGVAAGGVDAVERDGAVAAEVDIVDVGSETQFILSLASGEPLGVDEARSFVKTDLVTTETLRFRVEALRNGAISSCPESAPATVQLGEPAPGGKGAWYTDDQPLGTPFFVGSLECGGFHHGFVVVRDPKGPQDQWLLDFLPGDVFEDPADNLADGEPAEPAPAGPDPSSGETPPTPGQTSAVDFSGASLPTAAYGPGIDPYQQLDGITCSPTAKPGTVDFKNRVLAEYPGTGNSGIVRSCAQGSPSDHWSGRAWDWGVRTWVASERAMAYEMLRFLFAEDQFGHEDAAARRLGLQYIIWNHTIYRSYWGQQFAAMNYNCPGGGATECHRDHVHFSFSNEGAQKQTSWWTQLNQDTQAYTDAEGDPDGGGRWRLDSDGDIRGSSAPYRGEPKANMLAQSAVAMAPHRTNNCGYWVATDRGKVYDFGCVPHRGDVFHLNLQSLVTDISANRHSSGYYMVGSDGGVFAHNSPFYGSAQQWIAPGPTAAVAIETRDNANGYWVTASDGGMFAFNVPFHGSLPGVGVHVNNIVDMVSTKTGDGYWMLGSDGGVFAFGNAPYRGNGLGNSSKPFVSIYRYANNRYGLMDARGVVWTF